MISDNINRDLKEGERSIVDTVSAEDSTQAPVAAPPVQDNKDQEEFFKTLARYQSSYRCMVEEVLKSGGGNQAAVKAEEERLNRIEGELQRLAHDFTTGMMKDSSELDSLRSQLEKSRDKIIALKKNAHSHDEGSRLAEKTNMEDYKGQLSSSSAYARLYYTRLVFWAILAIMLVIVMFHAANSTSTGLLVNTIGIIVCLILGYYVLRFVYNRVF